MVGAIKVVQEQSLDEFLDWSISRQRKFINNIKVYFLKDPLVTLVLKKFIAMTVLMEARIAREDKNPLNLTHQVFNPLLEIAQVKRSQSECGYDLLGPRSRLTTIRVDDEFNIDFSDYDACYSYSYKNLDNDINEIKDLFSRIKDDSRYYTLGFIGLIRTVNFAHDYSPFGHVDYFDSRSKRILSLLTFLVACTVPVASLVPCLLLSTIEHITISPVQWLFDNVSKEPHEDFMSKVIEPKFDTADGEVRKNARILGQAWRQSSTPAQIGMVGKDMLAKISLFTAVKSVTSEVVGEKTALQYLEKPN